MQSQEDGRVNNSVKNAAMSVLAQAIMLFANFAVRKVFLMHLDSVYLGVNSLFGEVLTIFSLAELGFGTVMTYGLYKPLAQKDERKIAIYMRFYARVYLVIAAVVAVLGVIFVPFLDFFIKADANIQHLLPIYFLFLANTVFSYFFAYKGTLLSADQKERMVSRNSYLFCVVRSVLQIAVLMLFSNFLAYLLVQSVISLLEGVWISGKVSKLYPYLKQYKEARLDKEEMRTIRENVMATTLIRVGHVLLNATDHMIITRFVGLVWSGLFSNFSLITNALTTIFGQVIRAVTGSLGHFVAAESRQRQYELYRMMDLAVFWCYAFAAVCVYILAGPFVALWLGPSYVLDDRVVLVIAINFLISGILSLYWTFRSTMGLFVQGKYRSLVAAAINVIVSIWLAQRMGLVGVLLGTTIARVLVNLWYDPYLILRKGMDAPVMPYFQAYAARILLLVGMTLPLWLIKQRLCASLCVGNFVWLMVISVLFTNVALLAAFWRTAEFKQLLVYVRVILDKAAGIAMKLRTR